MDEHEHDKKETPKAGALLVDADDDFDDEDRDLDDDRDLGDDDDDDEGRGSRDRDRDDDAYEEDGKADYAKEVLEGILDRMGLDTDVDVREDRDRVVLDVSGPDAGRAIGKKGQTLDALQFLVNKVVNRFPEGRRYIVVDSGDYRERHDANLVNMARREAKRAVEQGRTITLQPMPARDRRLIHLSLAKFEGVTTKSNGEGLGRRIQIIPAGGSRGGGRRRRR
ncbi:MAG: protein jag [Sandaracinaceae bacterium]